MVAYYILQKLYDSSPDITHMQISYQNQWYQPHLEKELSSDWRSQLTPFPPEKNPIQVVDREKEFGFEDDFLLADTNQIR